MCLFPDLQFMKNYPKEVKETREKKQEQTTGIENKYSGSLKHNLRYHK